MTRIFAAAFSLVLVACGGPPADEPAEGAAAASAEAAAPETPAAPSAEDAFTLVMLGDSLTAGYELADPDVLVDALEAEVGDVGGRPLDVVNAGVSADTASGALARFDFSVPEGADGVLIEIGANDMFQQREPRLIAGDIAAMVEKAQERGLWVGVVGMKAPLNAGAYKAEFDALYPDLALHYCIPLYDFYFEGVTDPETGATRDDLLLPDGVHPNADGLRVIASRMGPWLDAALNGDEEPC
jgi:acyl-CoA thioesterase-1